MKNSELIQAVTTAYRERTERGAVMEHAQWHDLDAGGRREAFEQTVAARALEAAAHPRGLSSTALAVLGRITAR